MINTPPDVIWWNIVSKYYALVGGDTHDGLRCGGSCLVLDFAAGNGNWGIGALTYPSGYTPDGLRYRITNRDYCVVGGPTRAIDSKALGAFDMAINSTPPYTPTDGDIGASAYP